MRLLSSGMVAGVFCLLVSLSIFAGRAKAQDLKTQIQQCGSISDNLSRLQCFDAISKQPQISSDTSAPLASQSNSNWNVSESNNPLDDTKTITLTVSSYSGTDQQGNPINLIIRCQSKETDAFLDWGDFLGDDSIDISLRFGAAPVTQESWSISTNHTASFSPEPVPFIKRLMGAPTFVAQVIPYDANPIIATFDVSGLAASIGPLAKDCGWQ